MKRLFLCTFFPLLLCATPAQVILMRHAEEPSAGDYLSLKGRERSFALAPFFQGAPAVLANGTPAAIFAPNGSQSALQTVLPLCNAMALSVQDRFATDRTQELARELLNNPDYEGRTLLVCWPAEELPAIAKELGVQKPPKKWDGAVHDRLWILQFEENGTVTFQDAPQKLLYGDAAK